MTPRRFEISPRYFTSERGERKKYHSTGEQKFRTSKPPCYVLSMMLTPVIYQNFSLFIFFLAAKGAIYYVAIATAIYSYVKITFIFQVLR